MLQISSFLRGKTTYHLSKSIVYKLYSVVCLSIVYKSLNAIILNHVVEIVDSYDSASFADWKVMQNKVNSFFHHTFTNRAKRNTNIVWDTSPFFAGLW